jgi:CDGSH-type Zn-finger protein
MSSISMEFTTFFESFSIFGLTNPILGLDIGGKDLLTYVPILTTIGLTAYVIWQAMRPKIGLVNPNIEKDSKKVVNSMDIEDIGDKIAFCRCWRSKKFPLCDGSHVAHNRSTGDNVGPLCLKRAAASS